MSQTGDFIVLDPTGGRKKQRREARGMAPRPASLRGEVVAIITSGSQESPPIMDALSKELTRRLGLSGLVRIDKASTTTLLDRAAIERLARQAKAAVIGLGA